MRAGRVLLAAGVRQPRRRKAGEPGGAVGRPAAEGAPGAGPRRGAGGRSAQTAWGWPGGRRG